MSKFSRNKAAFDKIFKTMPYRAPAFEASTGKLNTDGTVHPNPSVGLDAGYVWIRRKGERAETRAIAGNVRTDIADIPVRVAQDNITGELTVVGIREGEAILRFGGEWASSLYAQTAGEAFRTTINGRNLKPGRVKVWISSTLKVNAETFWYNNTATARLLWQPSDANALDLSGNVPAAVSSVDYQRWVVIALNPNATTPALVAFNGTAVPITQTLLPKDIKDIAVTAGYTRLAAVQLRTGDTDETDITDGEWEDLRPWVVDVNYSAIVGAVITNSTIDSSPIGAATPSTAVFTSLHVDAPNLVTRFGDGSGYAAAAVDGGAGSTREINFQTDGVDRWIFGATSVAETGSNAGSDFALKARNDDGTQYNTVFEFRRSTGVMFNTILDTATNGITNSWFLRHNSSNATVAGFGMAVQLQLRKDTTNNTNAGRIAVRWLDVATPTAQIDFSAYDTAPRLGLSLAASGSAAMVGVFGVTPVVRAAATDDIKVALKNYGWLQGTSATPFNMDGGALTAGTTIVNVTDATDNAVVDVLTLSHNTSGTPATGLGTGVLFQSETSTTPDTALASIQASWATVTHASRKGRVTFNAYDTAVREAMVIEASGSAPMLGFLGAGAVIRQTITGSQASGAALADLITKLATVGLFIDGTSA